MIWPGMFLEDMDELFGILELATQMLDEAERENGAESRKGSSRPLSRRPTGSQDCIEVESCTSSRMLV